MPKRSAWPICCVLLLSSGLSLADVRLLKRAFDDPYDAAIWAARMAFNTSPRLREVLGPLGTEDLWISPWQRDFSFQVIKGLKDPRPRSATIWFKSIFTKKEFDYCNAQGIQVKCPVARTAITVSQGSDGRWRAHAPDPRSTEVLLGTNPEPSRPLSPASLPEMVTWASASRNYAGPFRWKKK